MHDSSEEKKIKFSNKDLQVFNSSRIVFDFKQASQDQHATLLLSG